jgi:inosine/xanthosine triphosphate pyrophosphatase family protein
MGLCKQPLDILPGGYSQYFDPSKGWQMQTHAAKPPRKYRMELQGRAAKRRAEFAAAK